MRPLLLFLALAAVAPAHVGSPDVFFEGDAGPYRLVVTIGPPGVIPGVAGIEIRSQSSDVRAVEITALTLTGPGAKFPPTPDTAQRSKDDPQFFTGSLWLMQTGSWQVRVRAMGDRGVGDLAVPVPALALRTATMQKGLGALLLGLLLFLAAGLVSIAAAAAREGPLDLGDKPDAANLRRGRVVAGVMVALVVAAIYLSNAWWNAEADAYSRRIYKPLDMQASVEPGEKLVLRLENAGWGQRLDNLIPDHNHLMHLFAIRLPEMDRLWHLHPEEAEAGLFTHDLPAMPAGRYQLYADVVHDSGLPETLVAQIEIPAISGKPLAGDDSTSDAPLPRDGRIIWERDPGPLRAKRPVLFRFRVEDAAGQPARDLELYMGMPGHAVFVRTDGSVFAHVHPSGSVPMAALALVQMGGDSHAGHAIHGGLPPEVSFPYGFPQPGEYRIFVQVKRAGRIETGVFDAHVENP